MFEARVSLLDYNCFCNFRHCQHILGRISQCMRSSSTPAIHERRRTREFEMFKAPPFLGTSVTQRECVLFHRAAARGRPRGISLSPGLCPGPSRLAARASRRGSIGENALIAAAHPLTGRVEREEPPRRRPSREYVERERAMAPNRVSISLCEQPRTHGVIRVPRENPHAREPQTEK